MADQLEQMRRVFDEKLAAVGGLPDAGAELRVSEATVIRPGDHLIVRCGDHVTRKSMNEIADIIKARLPMLGGVCVLGVDALYVVRDDDLRGVSDGG